MKIKSFFASLLACAFIMLEPVSTYAYQTDVVPEIEDRALSLTINFCYSKNDTDIPIPGAEVSINRISDLEVINGYAFYTVVDYEDYAELIKKDEKGNDVTFEGISGTESNKLAARFALKVPAPEQTDVTAVNGIVKFENLTAGMYLVRETNATGKALDYSYFEPFLVSVPLAQDYTGENIWIYDVLADPKTTVEEKPQPPDSSVPDSSIPDSSVSESSVPESSEPESSEPESSESESSEPESSVPESSEPESSEPESSNPESSVTESSAPKESSDSSEPSTPSKPSEPTSTPESSTPGIPVITGESSILLFVVVIFFISAFVITLTVNKKKRNDDTDSE